MIVVYVSVMNSILVLRCSGSLHLHAYRTAFRKVFRRVRGFILFGLLRFFGLLILLEIFRIIRTIFVSVIRSIAFTAFLWSFCSRFLIGFLMLHYLRFLGPFDYLIEIIWRPSSSKAFFLNLPQKIYSPVSMYYSHYIYYWT